jgi:hypothetical protein
MIAIPQPIINKEHKKTGKVGKRENSIAPANERIQENVRLFFSWYF